MADQIGVTRKNFDGGKWGYYYLIEEKQRQEALLNGATEIKMWEFSKLCFVSDEQARSDLQYLCDKDNGKHGCNMIVALRTSAKLLEHWETREQERQRLATFREENIAPSRRERSRHQVPFNSGYSRNPYILKWWSKLHDDMLARLIANKHWVWYYSVFDEVVSITSSEDLKNWREIDPLCQQYAWYNILRNFAAARAEELSLTKSMKKPVRRTCPLCKSEFVEDSVRYTFVKRLGVEQIDFCEPCLDANVFTTGQEMTKEEILVYIQNLTGLLQSIPPQDYGDGEQDFLAMTTEERLLIFKLIKNRPRKGQTKQLFGSWFHALIEAGVLESGTRKTSRGTQCLAKDGDICFSIGEKTIDDFLYTRGIIHEREPSYPESNYRADFRVGNVFIEYFGLAGNLDYDKKAGIKQSMCKKHNIKLIALYAPDLVSMKNLEIKILKSISPNTI